MTEHEARELVEDWAVKVLPARIVAVRVAQTWGLRVSWSGERWECTSSAVAARFLLELAR